MKKTWIIVLSLLLVTALFANSVVAGHKATISKKSRYEIVAYSEDFESGATGWTHVDGAVSPSEWHIYNEGATQGNVWWMGDPSLASGTNIGGYHDHQYLVLDTPQILVPTATPTLTFKVKYNVEATAGATAPYTGWDACNVRISTNNGATWTPISGTPAYNMTSSYAFGFEHGEGANIPGWGGSSNGWQNATFNLTTYAGQNVKIRFAFASDPAYSTADAPAMFGMMVDDIALGSYTNNGVNDGQMTWASMVPLGGDLWHLAVVADAPSPTHAYVCQNAQMSYNPNMMNYLYSPQITLPESGDIRCDFMFKANMTDANAFPENDYFGWEISPDGVIWYAMSNPYGSSTGSNYVYPPPTTNPTSWYSMTEYFSLDGYISDYAGETVQFRWYLKSDADTPNGVGFMVDDFKIYNDIFLAEPSNLIASVNGADVTLNWSPPGGGGQPGWLHYDNGTNDSAIGLTNGGNMEVACKWAPAGLNSILPYVGMNITQVKFYPNQAGVTYTIKIYTGAAGNEVYSQVVSNPVIGDWNTVTLTTPFTIPTGQYVWVGYMCPHTAGQFPAGNDAGPAVAGFGDMYKTGGSWNSLFDVSAGETDLNWNIQAYVADATGKAVMIDSPMQTPTRDITEYKIYRDDVAIGSVLGTVLTYTDTNVAGGLHAYKITAMYGVNESLPSNTATTYVIPAGQAELAYDDNTAEQGFNVGSTNMMAVKFQNQYVSTLKFIKVYVTSVGASPMIIRIYDDNGVDGMPGSQHLTQFTYASSSIVEGWNYIPVPTGSEVTINDGIFYVAILEYTSSSSVGLDTNQFGHSYKKLATGAWEALTNGEVQLRCIVLNGDTGIEGEEIMPIVLSSSNYPNPFNPETSINYNVPKDGQTSLTIYNTKGQIVRSLVNAHVKAGSYKAVWNGTDNNGNAVSSGVYFYRLNNGSQSITKKMLLSK
jgi:hypothetical protein